MRRVDRADDFATGLHAAKAEAEAAFGDNSVLLEKYILNPRHLEVQLAGDRTGSLVHLFERDCSVQRNNQKVLEEAPAPNFPDRVRTRLLRCGAQARPRHRLRFRWHGRVHHGAGQRQSVFPGDEHAAAGRASRDRTDHRHRSGRMAIAGGRRREASADPGRNSPSAAMPSRPASRRNGPTSGFSRSPASWRRSRRRVACGSIPAWQPAHASASIMIRCWQRQSRMARTAAPH